MAVLLLGLSAAASDCADRVTDEMADPHKMSADHDAFAADKLKYWNRPENADLVKPAKNSQLYQKNRRSPVPVRTESKAAARRRRQMAKGAK